MINKKLIVLVIFIVSLLTISVASATENVTSDVVSIGDSSDEFVSVNADYVNETAKATDISINVDDNNKVGVTEENELGASYGSFYDLSREIVNANGTLDLTRDYSYKSSIDDYYDGIPIDLYQRTITINGNGHTIDGKGQGRGFVNDGTWGVVLKNINFKNINGGAVYSTRFTANWILSGCSFVNCYSDDGGAVTFYGANSTLTDCSFVNCSGDDGAVYWNADNSTLSRCDFIDCSAKYGGGAVNCKGVNSTLSRCTFENCYARYGGAVYWQGDNGSLSNCDFKNCSALNTGGAVYWGSTNNGVLTQCDFVKCFSGAQGGAVYWGSINGVLSNCFFGNCHSNFSSGGAIYWGSINGVLYSCTFSLCDAKSQGGVVNWNGANGTLFDCGFYTCFSNSSGGAVYGEGDNSKLFNCVFTYCSSDGSGGAVYWNGDGCSVAGSDFQNCYSKWYGGGIFISGKNCSLSNSSFQDCTADKEGSWYYGSNSLNVTINKIPTVITAQDITTTYGVPKNLVVTLTDRDNNFLSGEKILIELNNYEYSLKTNSNGETSFDIPADLIPKTYVATIRYSGNDMYSSSNVTVRVVVNKVGSALIAHDVTAVYKGGEYWVATLKDEKGNVISGAQVKILLNGETKTITTDDWGYVPLTIDSLVPNTYAATITFDGNDIYVASTTNSSVVVNKAESVLTVIDITTVYNSGKNLVATLKDENGNVISGAQVKISLNGETKNLTTDNKGQVSLTTDGLVPNTYIATITFDGNEFYIRVSTTCKVMVNKLETRLTVKYDKNSKNIVATIKDANYKPVSGLKIGFEINGVEYVVSDVNGQAKCYASDMTDENYTVTVRAYGNEIYADSNNETVTVPTIKISTTLTASDVTTVYNEGENLVATLKDENGNVISGAQVKISLNGETKNLTTDNNGQVSLTTDGLVPNTYIATITFDSNDIYITSTTTATVVVNKARSVLTASSISTVYNDGKKLVVTLKDNNGQTIKNAQVKISLNGETKNLTTDNKGQVSLTTDGLVPNTYIATITFVGNINYDKSTKSVKVNVKKATPKIIAKTKTFKKSVKTKKYSITLKNNLNKVMKNTKVTIKVNKKTYTAKTNSKGIATFKITKLTKKGTFKSVINYVGSKYYNKVTKTINIKCK
ncbi:hypothetical protein [Methanobrevibacter sp.]|uniref:hypothetical protein n=1 Tax=Methanobrevibacter sp. TaxID=66852 RepID=UPI00388E6C1B